MYGRAKNKIPHPPSPRLGFCVLHHRSSTASGKPHCCYFPLLVLSSSSPLPRWLLILTPPPAASSACLWPHPAPFSSPSPLTTAVVPPAPPCTASTTTEHDTCLLGPGPYLLLVVLLPKAEATQSGHCTGPFTTPLLTQQHHLLAEQSHRCTPQAVEKLMKAYEHLFLNFFKCSGECRGLKPGLVSLSQGAHDPPGWIRMLSFEMFALREAKQVKRCSSGCIFVPEV